jgi:hypothetical protein
MFFKQFIDLPAGLNEFAGPPKLPSPSAASPANGFPANFPN